MEIEHEVVKVHAATAEIVVRDRTNPEVPASTETVFLGIPSEHLGPTTKRAARFSVGEKTHPCDVYEIRMALHGPTPLHRVEIWKAPGAPSWALVYDFKVGGDG